MTRRRGLVIAIVAALVIGSGALAAYLLTRATTPEDATLEYFRALESGQQDAVSAAIEVPSETLALFASADERVSSAQVTASDIDGATAEVTVSFVLDDEPRESVLTLIQEGPSWRIDPATAVGTLTVTTEVGGVVVGGADMIDTGDAVPILPAVYSVAAAPTDLLDDDARVAVLPGADDTVLLAPELRPAAVDIAQQHLDDHLTGCTAPAAVVPKTCGIRIPWAADLAVVDEIRYRVETLPTVTLTADGFLADAGVLVATVTGTDHEGSSDAVTYRTENWSVRGDVTFTADDIELSIW